MAEYRGVNGVARKITKVYRGVDGIARKVKTQYRGVSGVARKFFSADPALSGILTSKTASGLPFTPNFCAFQYEGVGTGGHSSYSATGCGISTNTTGTMAGYGGIDNASDSVSSKTGTATFGAGTMSISMSAGITAKTVKSVCGYASDIVFGTFGANNNQFSQTITTNFTPNFIALCCDTMGTGGWSGRSFAYCGWTPTVGATSTSGTGNLSVTVSYSSTGVTVSAAYNSSIRYGTVRYIVARI